MAKKHGEETKARAGLRITRNISFPPDQDLWLSELIGAEGNLSAFIQQLVELARSGRVDTSELLQKSQRQTDGLERAVAYLKAKEAGMLFEEDVANTLKALNKRYRVSRGRIHNGGLNLYVADFSIETQNGDVVVNVACKSSPRADKLQLALAEAMIGQQRTGRPVVTVVPYFLTTEDERKVQEQFKLLNIPLVELRHLIEELQRTLRH